ncbi:MAG TPA: dihydrolipoyl dehydrogenase [Caulobacteraceae bacterium]|nr:dihydrolipoyl dehydrogenase [Caulobacteraceae bacterium]
MSETITARVLVVGGGPGGYVAAIRAGQLGLDTVLVEAGRVGGTCLIRGCIPSKALIHAASAFSGMRETAAGAGAFGITLADPPSLDLAQTVRWKAGVVDTLNNGVKSLLKRAKVRTLEGWATFSDAKTCSVETASGPVTITAEHVILANGSLPVEIPALPFGGPIISSTEALELDALPARLVVVGAGYIGLELGSAFRKFGCEVTVVEALDRILPAFDAQLAGPVAKWLEKAGVGLRLGVKAKAVENDGVASVLVVEDKDGAVERLPADRILVTVGRRPNTQGWGLETMAIDMAGPFVRIDDRCRTSMKDVWAIGDLTGEPMLEHRAASQGEMVAEIIAGARRRFDPVAIAAVCFTEPEIVTAGLSPDEAKAAGGDPITGVFPFSANGRARSMDAADDGGFVRVVARRDDHRLLGVQAVGAHVSELSGEFALALEMGARLEDIAGTIHVHPTLSEAFHEAALRALGHAIHV